MSISNIEGGERRLDVLELLDLPIMALLVWPQAPGALLHRSNGPLSEGADGGGQPGSAILGASGLRPAIWTAIESATQKQERVTVAGRVKRDDALMSVRVVAQPRPVGTRCRVLDQNRTIGRRSTTSVCVTTSHSLCG